MLLQGIERGAHLFESHSMVVPDDEENAVGTEFIMEIN
jgi:hypothetical protein